MGARRRWCPLPVRHTGRTARSSNFSGTDQPATTSELRSQFHFPAQGQYLTGDCWTFGSTSYFESEAYRRTGGYVREHGDLAARHQVRAVPPQVRLGLPLGERHKHGGVAAQGPKQEDAGPWPRVRPLSPCALVGGWRKRPTGQPRGSGIARTASSRLRRSTGRRQTASAWPDPRL